MRWLDGIYHDSMDKLQEMSDDGQESLCSPWELQRVGLTKQHKLNKNKVDKKVLIFPLVL